MKKTIITAMSAVITRYYSIALVGLLLLQGCHNASMPLQEISDAHQAIQIAQSYDASYPVSNPLQPAQRYLMQAEAALAVGETAMAKQQALSAKQSAVQVYQCAKLISETRQSLLEVAQPNKKTEQGRTLLEQAVLAFENSEIARAMTLANQAADILMYNSP